MQITCADYWMGRDALFPGELSDETRHHAADLVPKVNALLTLAQRDGVTLRTHPKTGTYVSSGWRPSAVNAAIANAAKRSNHMIGNACDIYDPDGALDAWCEANLIELVKAGLWLESPASTPIWCHLQRVPPHSGNRVFHP